MPSTYTQSLPSGTWVQGLYIKPKYCVLPSAVVMHNVERLILESQVTEFTRIQNTWGIELIPFSDSSIYFGLINDPNGHIVCITETCQTNEFSIADNLKNDSISLRIIVTTPSTNNSSEAYEIATWYTYALQNILETAPAREFAWRPKLNQESDADYAKYLRFTPALGKTITKQEFPSRELLIQTGTSAVLILEITNILSQLSI